MAPVTGYPTRRPAELNDPQWLRERYDAGMSLMRIADELGVGSTTIHRAMVRMGVPTRPRRRADTSLGRLQDVEWLREKYVDEQQRLDEIACEVGCAVSTVWLAVERLGLDD